MFEKKHKGRHSAKVSKRRVSRETLVEAKAKRSRRHRFGIVLGIIVVALAVALGVGIYAYFSTSDAKLDLAPSNASEALTKAESGKPYYILCAADLGISKSAPASYDTPINNLGYMLVRIDEAGKKITFVTIPSNLYVPFADSQYLPLYEAESIGGDAELIRRVSGFFDVPINHFAYTTADGIRDMVDMISGVEVDITDEVDDPYAGTEVLFTGEQMLNGDQALVYIRATNFADSIEAVSKNRVKFTMAFAEMALSNKGLAYATLVGEAGDYINTDLTASDLLALGDAVRPLYSFNVYDCVIPGYEMQDDATGKTVYQCYNSDWSDMLKRIVEGEDPIAKDTSADSVNTSDVKVEVRNGTQMVGAASQMAEILEKKGYEISEVRNTDDNTIYPETLVVYTDPKNEAAAKAVLRDLGSGRLVNGGDFYTTEADVISIVGADWMPVN